MKASEILRLSAVANGRECPECGDRDTHMDNGERGTRLSYACRQCGAHWDAEEWRSKVPDDAATQVASALDASDE